MADNVNIKPSADVTAVPVAADDIGGVKYQRIKAGWGADGAYNDSDIASGKGMPGQNVAGSQADGHSATLGTTTDAAITSNANGTAIGFLRGLVSWAYTRMPTSLGQKVKTASLPVVLPSDQDALAVTGTFWQTTQPTSVADVTALRAAPLREKVRTER